MSLLFNIGFSHQTTAGWGSGSHAHELFNIGFSHQTTAMNEGVLVKTGLFNIGFSHQTTAATVEAIMAEKLFNIGFSHQTTATAFVGINGIGYSISVLVIKPQLYVLVLFVAAVIQYRF